MPSRVRKWSTQSSQQKQKMVTEVSAPPLLRALWSDMERPESTAFLNLVSAIFSSTSSRQSAVTASLLSRLSHPFYFHHPTIHRRRRHFPTLLVRLYLSVIIWRWKGLAHVLDPQPRITVRIYLGEHLALPSCCPTQLMISTEYIDSCCHPLCFRSLRRRSPFIYGLHQ